MSFKIAALAAIAPSVLLLAACGSVSEPPPNDGVNPAQPGTSPAAGTRPSGQPNLITVEGQVSEGVECSVIRTSSGETWAVNFGEADFGPGDYVQIIGEVADASFCMEGKGTLIPQEVRSASPPARGDSRP